MRAFTHYEQIEHDQPGTPARVHTVAHREDLAALMEDIRQARAHTDCVIVSMHWGIHFVPGEIAAYQREVGHAAIDAGAAIVLGHHPHVLKGVEVYRGKAIFYSLGNFALEAPQAFMPDVKRSQGFKEVSALASEWGQDDPLPRESLRSVLVKCVINRGEITAIDVRPVYLNRAAEPEILSPSDPRYREVSDYLNWATVSQGLNGILEQRGEGLALRPGT
jgi:poly-gamma-glutamate synthesis protein (capsule biosynthesis protein)